LQRSDLLSPTAVASILAGVLAALLTIGVLLRRRRRSVVRLDDLEPEEGEAER
jgi:LPXTG-motif cell wall-anchored protein